MQQHSVPQNIASFKFKLFGSLTARQFFTLIIPLSLAAVLFFSGVPSLIRIPLSFAIGGFAFFIALVPVGGRPFDQWAVAFIKAVMSPTQRVWVKEKKIPEFLTLIITPPTRDQQIPEEFTSKKKEKLIAYLKTLPKENASPLDVKEEIALQDIDYSTQTVASLEPAKPIPTESLPPPIIWPKVIIQQRPQPKITSTFAPADVKLPYTPIPYLEQSPQLPQPKVSLHAKPYILAGVEKRLAAASRPAEHQYVELVSEPTVSLASDTNYSIDNIIPVRTWDNRIKLVHGIGTTRARKLHFAPPVNFDISKLPIRGEKRFEISDELKKHYQFEDINPPVVLPIEREPGLIPQVTRPLIQVKPQNIPQKAKGAPGPTGQQVPTTASAPQKSDSSQFSITDLKKQELAKKQISSAEIVPLTKTPNVVSGQVVDTSGAAIAGAVLVIRNEQGIPVRALKTNKLGQFLSATPLTSGTYNIETESELASFNPFSILLKNQIVSPIAIVAAGTKST